MRKISAHYIFPVNATPLKRAVITFDDNGTIHEIIDTAGELEESEQLEFYDGILVPGFVNTHCHLELSHLMGCMPMHTGLACFLKNIGQQRNNSPFYQKMVDADKEMHRNGIVAVADISNTSDSFLVKQKSPIRYWTFVEVFGIKNNEADTKYLTGLTLNESLKPLGLSGTLTPHATYSLSEDLWIKLIEFSNNGFWSVHNQETEDENKMFQNKTGSITEFLFSLSADFYKWESKGMTSLKYCTRYFEKLQKILLVHNTFISADDLASLRQLKTEFVFVLCPNANLYIEDKLPDIDLIRNSGCLVTIGTDSYASNHQLSILDEMKTIQKYFPNIPFIELLQWGTLNGAKAIGFQNELGSFAIGKKPGINLITNFDFKNFKLTDKSEVKKIV